MRTLTRQEAAERAGLIAVEAYDVALDFTIGATTFRSTTRLRFGCRQPGEATFVEFLASGRPSMRLNGHVLDDGAYDGERIRLRDLDAINELVVEADCEYTDTGEGIHRFVDPEDGETYLYSNAFLYEAQRIFACFDQPDLKATFSSVSSRLSAGQSCPTGRDPRRRVVTGRSSRLRGCRRPHRDLCGTYDSFASVRDGIPLAVHCRRSMARYVEADDMLDDAQVALAFFRDLSPGLSLLEVRPRVRSRDARRHGERCLHHVRRRRLHLPIAGHRRPAARADRRHRP